MINSSQADFAAHIEAIIDGAIDGILTIDDKGTVESINPAAAKLFGYPKEQVIGNNIKMLMPAPYKAEHDGYISRYNKTKEPRIIGIGREVKGLRKSGEIFPFRLAVSEVILNDRIIFTGVVHDLSNVKKAEEEIHILNKNLEETVTKRTYELEKVINTLLSTNTKLENEVKERTAAEEKLKENELQLNMALNQEKVLNEMKSRFVSMASHEFRTPLTSILSSASLIYRYPTAAEQPIREKHVNKIKAAVSNLTGILNDFLSLSKLEEGKVGLNFTEIDFEELCKEVQSSTKALIRTKRTVKTETSGTHRVIFSDQHILRNILFNLISNAIKYSEKDILCHINYGEEHFQIEIKDEGIGIPLEDQKHIFTRFFRAENVNNIQGTGLGLNIVRRYVELLDGEIGFESIVEEGTTFTVRIPYKEM